MSTKMTAPIGGGGNEKLETELLPTGFQLCKLYGIVDVGTQEGGKFGPKHQLGMQFEFPLEQRVFFDGDDPRSIAIYMENNYSMHENARLRGYVEGMVKKMTDSEAADFDISSLLGKWFVANIEHSANGKYANIKSLSAVDDKNIRMFGLEGNDRPDTHNDSYFFYIPQGFNSENFKSLPEWLRNKCKKSIEGQSHASAGGTFSEPDGNNTSSSKPSAPPSSGGKKIVMISTDYTYEQYKESWTDEQLVAAGHAKWVDSTPSAPPKPQSPPTPPSAPSAPSAPVAPVALGKHQSKLPDGSIFTLSDASWVFNEMIGNGWTIQSMIEAGHGSIEGDDANPHDNGVPF